MCYDRLPSRYIFIRPQRDKDATSTASAFWIILVSLDPRQIRSDRGTEFINHVWDSLLTMLKVKRYSTAPYRSQAHGTVENANRQLITLLANIICVICASNSWHLFLPSTVAIEPSHHTDTGIPPATGFGLKGPHMNEQLNDGCRAIDGISANDDHKEDSITTATSYLPTRV